MMLHTLRTVAANRWTSICGLITLIGGVSMVMVPTVLGHDELSGPHWAMAVSIVAGGLGLLGARDGNKSSERVGAR